MVEQEYLPWKKFEWMSPHQLNYDFIKGLEPVQVLDMCNVQKM